MPRRKTPRTEEFRTFPNALVAPENIKGKWHSHFGNKNPISLELGCGKGEYTNRLGSEFPDRNFIGIDLKAPRLWRGAKNALDAKLSNVRFLQINIEKLLDYFEQDEVSEIFIPFPDPFPKLRKEKKRMVNAKFLEIYRKILIPGGLVHLKTDNEGLYLYALSVIESAGHTIHINTDDLYNSPWVDLFNSIPSYFEQIFIEKGIKIKYIRFSFRKT